MDKMTNDDKIRAALSDPDAPWYGSDLVDWVAELLAEKVRLEHLIYNLQSGADMRAYYAAIKEFAEIYRRVRDRTDATTNTV